MTELDLEKLVRAGNPKRLATALEKLSESERRGLSATALRLRKSFESWDEPGTRCAQLAILGVGSLGAAKKVVVECVPDEDFPALAKILSDRRPDWVDAWFVHHLRRGRTDWELIRELIRRRACAKPTDDQYYIMMARDLLEPYADEKRYKPLSKRLLAEPDLLDDIWRFFDTEQYGFTDLFTRYNKNPKFETWAVALKKLSDQGKIDRQRLLDCSLAALQRDFKQNLLTGFVRFHETMEPTADELRARQGTYIDLLTVSTNHVVSFATKMLKRIDEAKRLDDGAFVAAAERVFAKPAKNSAMTVVGLLEKIGKRSPKLVPEALKVLVNCGLLHSVGDVQAASLKLVSAWQKQLDPALGERLAAIVPALPATLRPLAQQLIDSAGGDSNGATKKKDAGKKVKVKSAAGPAKAAANRIAACQTAASRLPETGNWTSEGFGRHDLVREWISLTWPASGETARFASPALYEPDRPFGEFSRMAVVLAGADAKEDSRRRAIDLLVEGIADGRIHPRPLGETLVRFAVPMPPKSELQAKNKERQRLRNEVWSTILDKSREGRARSKAAREALDRLESTPEPFSLARLSASLAKVARVSPVHAWVVAGALEALLASYKSPTEDVRHLLALLLEVMTQLGLAPGEQARAVVAMIKGSGKTASLAKSLAALKPQSAADAEEARLMVAAKRIERAELWARAN
jgi:hypothetical protein